MSTGKKAPHIGAALSHAKIIKKFKNDVNTICIFEDDIKLKMIFRFFLKAIEHTPPGLPYIIFMRFNVTKK